MIPNLRAAANAAVVTSTGISNCPMTTFKSLIELMAFSTWVTVTLALAPGTTMIRLSPPPSTQIGATPLEPGTVARNCVFTP